MSDKLEVPRRRVLKKWFVGLDPDPVDRSHPDVHDDQLIQDATIKNSMSRKFLLCLLLKSLLCKWVKRFSYFHYQPSKMDLITVTGFNN